jgi:hypothetical protein
MADPAMDVTSLVSAVATTVALGGVAFMMLSEPQGQVRAADVRCAGAPARHWAGDSHVVL